MMTNLQDIGKMNLQQFAAWTNQLYQQQMTFIYQHWYEGLKAAFLQKHQDHVFLEVGPNWQDYQEACKAIMENQDFEVPENLQEPGADLEQFKASHYVLDFTSLSLEQRIQELLAFERLIIQLEPTIFDPTQGWPSEYEGEDLKLFVTGYLNEVLLSNLPKTDETEESKFDLLKVEFLCCLERGGLPNGLRTLVYKMQNINDILLMLENTEFRKFILSIQKDDTQLINSGILDDVQEHAKMLDKDPKLVEPYKKLHTALQEQNIESIWENFNQYYQLIKEMSDRNLTTLKNPLLNHLRLTVTLAQQLINGEIQIKELLEKLNNEKNLRHDRNKILRKLLSINIQLKNGLSGNNQAIFIHQTRGFYDELLLVQQAYPRPYLKNLIHEIESYNTFDERRKLYDQKNQELTAILENLYKMITNEKLGLIPSNSGLANEDSLGTNPIEQFLNLLQGLKVPGVDLSRRHLELSLWLTDNNHLKLFKFDSRMQWLQRLVNAIFSALGKREPVFAMQKLRGDLLMFKPRENENSSPSLATQTSKKD